MPVLVTRLSGSGFVARRVCVRCAHYPASSPSGLSRGSTSGLCRGKGVDARDEPAHDDEGESDRNLSQPVLLNRTAVGHARPSTSFLSPPNTFVDARAKPAHDVTQFSATVGGR